MSFTNIAGYSNEKKSLKEICHLLRHYDEIASYDLHLPAGVLLVGEPGVGKTALAEAMILEAGVPCVRINHTEISPSTPFAELLRTRFEEAARVQPSILFLDEMEKLLGNTDRNASPEVGILLNAIQSYRRPGILLLATANSLRYIPDSLYRSGRFDRILRIPLPSLADRTEILRYYLKGQELDNDLSLEEFARLTKGYSGADLACILNEVGIRKLLDGHAKIRRQDLVAVIDEKQMNGVSRPTEQSDLLKVYAYHEAGHLAAALLYDPSCVENASIQAQGDSSGHASMVIPVYSKSSALAQIRVALAGRCAERIFFPKEVYFGSRNDYRRAHEMAEELLLYENCYGSKYFHRGPSIRDSREKRYICEIKTERLVEACERETKRLLWKHKPLIERLASLLLERCYLQRQEILEVYRTYSEHKGGADSITGKLGARKSHSDPLLIPTESDNS